MLYEYTIFPLECIYKIFYLGLYELLQNYGVSLIILSLAAHILLASVMEWGKRFQLEEKRVQEILRPQIAEIKANLSGAAAHKELEWLYKRYGYHPALAVRSAMTVVVQLPFLLAAYYMLLQLPDIVGVSFGAISDLSEPDGLLGGVNLLPILMTLINFGATAAQKDFSGRDRIQAWVIALLFLILLYDAPAALLVYWTGNNFWMLLEAWGQKSRAYVMITQKISAAAGGVWRVVVRHAVPLTLALTICLFVPIDFYLSNADEIWFTLPDILPYLLTATFVLWLVLALPAKFLPSKGASLYAAVLLGLAACFFLQSYLLNFNYGELIGAEIKWEKYRALGVFNTLIWLLVLFAALFYARKWLRYTHRLRSFLTYGSALIIAAQVIPLCYVGATQTFDKHHLNTLTTKNMLTVSAKDNIIVIVLDMFDTRFFRDAEREEPKLMEELDGFTYYPDAVSVFGLTAYSVPQMLTGAIYDNTELYADFINEAWRDHKFYKLLQRENYDIGIYTTGIFVGDDAPAENLVTAAQGKFMRINRHTLRVYADLVLFRSLPHFLKKNFVVYSEDLWQQEDSDAQIFSDDNLNFYRQLEQGINLNDHKNSFRWYHIRGAHFPFTMTRDLKPAAEGVSTQTDQAVGALKIALAYLKQMKEKGIYDRATIVILADHGKHATGEENDIDKFKPVPLLLVKQPGERGILRESANPVTFERLLATLAKRFGAEAAEFGEDFSVYDDSDRLFRYLITADSNHPIIEYKVKPQAENGASWEKVRVIAYEPRRKSNNYRLGSTLVFGTGEQSEGCLVKGWGHPVEGGVSSNDVLAEIDLSLVDLKPNRDLFLKITAGAMAGSEQNIGLSVNGRSVCVWQMRGDSWDEYTAKIPCAVLDGHDCRLEFSVSNPLKAWDSGKYFLMGFGLQKLTLGYAK